MAGRGKKGQCWYFTNSLLRHITRPSRTSLFNSILWSSCSLGSETNVPIFLCQIFKSMQYHSIHSHSTSSQSFLCIFWCICVLVFSLALPYSHWFEIKPCSPFAWKAPAIHPGEGRSSEAVKSCRGGVLLFHSWTEQRLLRAKGSMEKNQHRFFCFQQLASTRHC